MNAVSLWRALIPERVLLEDDLPGDDERLRIAPEQQHAQLLGLDGDLGPDGEGARRGEAERPAEPAIARERLPGAPLQRLDLVCALEGVGVDHGDADEDHALEVAGEHAEQHQESVTAEPAVAADEEDRHRPARIRLLRRGRLLDLPVERHRLCAGLGAGRSRSRR